VLLVFDAADDSSKKGARFPTPLLVIQDTKAIMDYFEEQQDDALESSVSSISSKSSRLREPLLPRGSGRKKTVAFASMLMELLADEWLIIQAMYWRWGAGIHERQKQFVAYEFGNSATAGGADYKTTMNIAEKVRESFPASTASQDIHTCFSRILRIHSANVPRVLTSR
jgi:hypothetical protein